MWLLVIFIAVPILAMGNFWYKEDTVLKKIKQSNPHVKRVIDSTRNTFSDSIVVILENDGDRVEYCIDSNILYRYRVKLCQK